MPEFAAYEPRADGHLRPASPDLFAWLAEPSDYPGIAAIAAAREGTTPEAELAALARFAEKVAREEAYLFVAKLRGVVVGFAKASYFRPPPNSPINVAPEGWYLSGVVVAPEHRRRGIGAALTEMRLNLLGVHGAERVRYFVNARNRASIDLHAAFGFLEETRDFCHPHADFEGGTGVLYVRDRAGVAGLLVRIDHLVYAVPDVDAAVADIERRLGARPSPGGSHPGRGTRNALLSIGPRSYLEILGPDPDQPVPPGGRWFGIDEVREPRLARWAANTDDLGADASNARAHGVDLGSIERGSRRAPGGENLAWTLTNPQTVVAGGLVPFLIDWGSSPHPSSTSAKGPRLSGLRAEHPQPERVRWDLAALDLGLPVTPGTEPRLVATFVKARSRSMEIIELR